MRRFESAIVAKPCGSDIVPAGREGMLFTLLAEHTRALDAADHVAAIRAATELASIAFSCLREVKKVKAPPAERTPLAIGPHSAWFQWAGGPIIDMRRRRASRLVLEVLVAERLARPGVAVPARLLISGGWPGEIMRSASAMSRLYVTVLSLRNLGLRDAVFAQDGGYLLDPSLDVSRTA